MSEAELEVRVGSYAAVEDLIVSEIVGNPVVVSE